MARDKAILEIRSDLTVTSPEMRRPCNVNQPVLDYEDYVLPTKKNCPSFTSASARFSRSLTVEHIR